MAASVWGVRQACSIHHRVVPAIVVRTTENRLSRRNRPSSTGESWRRAVVASSTARPGSPATRWGRRPGPVSSNPRSTRLGKLTGPAGPAGWSTWEELGGLVATAPPPAVPDSPLPPSAAAGPRGTPPPELTVGGVPPAPGALLGAPPPPPTAVALGAVAGAVVEAAVVGGLVSGGWVVAGAVVGGAVVGAAVVGGAVVAGSVVGGPVDPGGSSGCAARMLADPTSRSPMVMAATTSTRTGRRAVASSRWRWVGARRCLGWG